MNDMNMLPRVADTGLLFAIAAIVGIALIVVVVAAIVMMRKRK